MKDGYPLFLWRHRGELGFGFILMALSSFGQTFYISLFGADIRAAYGLSDGGLGTAYAVATTASAVSINWVGRWIDRVPVARYTLATALVLAMACVTMAMGTHLAVLVGAFYLLRLGGQGLMVHISQTTTARAFPGRSGQALGFTGLGMALGEALMPPLAVSAIAAFGWRAIWGAGAAAVLLGTALALRCRGRQHNALRTGPGTATVLPATEIPFWRDRLMVLSIPAVLASPFISTGFFFHQARLADEKHWALGWVAAWFVAYAAARATSMVAIGPVIDRLGAVRTLPWQLLPLGVAMVALVVSDSPWSVPFYLLPVGMAAGIANTLLTALWMELYGPGRLAAVRSWITAASVLASGLSPTLFGWLVDLGVPLWEQAAGCLAYIVLAAWLASRIARPRPKVG
jgi:MFS family permease